LLTFDGDSADSPRHDARALTVAASRICTLAARTAQARDAARRSAAAGRRRVRCRRRRQCVFLRKSTFLELWHSKNSEEILFLHPVVKRVPYQVVAV
jgi:hypothetical protein